MRFSLDGLPQISFQVGPNELVRGATFARGSGQIVVPVGYVDLYIADAAEIVQILLLTQGGPGACTLDIWRDTYANFPPTIADTIFSGGLPTISGGDKYSDTTLTDVNTNCAAGDVLRFNLATSSTFTRVSSYLVLRKL